ncbi:MAG: hypothetical protein K2I10_06190 [Lachnospiraceae bacterium]|nr:hypothetical protein [Lachnospiraceae bacterium]
MTILLTFRDNIKAYYSRYDYIFTPIVKFVFSLLLFFTLNAKMGYLAVLNNTLLVVLISIICAFLPIEVMAVIGGIFIVFHSAKVSLDVGLVAALFVLIFYCGFMRFSPKMGVIVFLVPFFNAAHIMYALPLLLGFLIGPAAVIPAAFGVILYHYENGLSQLVNVLAAQVEEDDTVGGYQYILEVLIQNKEMLLTIVVFTFVILVTYVFYRMSFEHSWIVAFLMGGFLNVVLFLIGRVALSIEVEIGSVLLGSILSIIIAFIIQFFKGIVDYQKAELLQFEDEQYYYYVKAVPKVSVSVSNRNVKYINSKMQN